jgi:amidophosphoribosyltransferase
MLMTDRMIAVRDPHGFRPLALGRLDDGFVVCSETCAMDLIGATYVRDIEPGEVLVISDGGVRSIKPFGAAPLAHCVFEHVYFARPDSQVFGRNVLESRLLLGQYLAREAPADADIVVPVPDSGMGAALGYSQESGLPFAWGLIRNHYVGRTFIEPKQSIRSFGVKIKLNPVRGVLEGKRVVLIDDSIVRGTTSKKIVGMVRAAGAAQVHMRISSPPTTGPCYYGIDTPLKSELIASRNTVEEIRQYIGADSLAYLSPEGLLRAVNDSGGERHCTACFTGKYPVAVAQPDDWQMRLFEKARA